MNDRILASVDAEFADALKMAVKNGVDVRAVNCRVSEDTLEILGFVETRI